MSKENMYVREYICMCERYSGNGRQVRRSLSRVARDTYNKRLWIFFHYVTKHKWEVAESG